MPWWHGGEGLSGLEGRIAAAARRFGPLPWSEFMEAALYDPDRGFYVTGGSAGRRGDFVTSPEIGPLFAAVWARALDRWWEELGRPDPYVVVEAAAGAGTLARDILAAGPACAPALRYVLVDRSAALREAQIGRLPLELPAFVLGPADTECAEADDDDGRIIRGTGPMVTSLADLPAVPFTGIVLANELLDNMALDLLEWRHGGWNEVRVAAAADRAGSADVPAAPPSHQDRLAEVAAAPPAARDRLVEVLVPAPPEVAAMADRLVAVRPAEGARIPIQRAAGDWLRRALSLVERGRVVVVDYHDTTAALAASVPASWLRTFRQHQAGLSPLQAPGSQDITCVVAHDQLAGIRTPTSIRSQADWLAGHGLDQLVDAARATWRERAAIGDLEALKARSRVHEGEALSDPEGLGGFGVLEWIVGGAA